MSWRAEWKCATTTSGGQCVMIPGAVLMLMWLADSWDMPVMVRAYNYNGVAQYIIQDK